MDVPSDSWDVKSPYFSSRHAAWCAMEDFNALLAGLLGSVVSDF